jgi:hypothetical protein
MNHRTSYQAATVYAALHRAAQASGTGINWTNLAIAVGGLATAGALLVSLFLLRQQIRNQRQAQQDRHLDHASHISFWLTLQDVDDGTDPVYRSGKPAVRVGVHLVNSSLQPAMSVLVTIGIRRDVWHDASVRDKTKYDELGTEWSAVAIAPGDKKDFQLSLSVPRSVTEIVDDYKDPAIVGELFFTDALGVSWVRTHTGTLIERGSAEWISSIPLGLAERAERRRNSQQADRGNASKPRRLLLRLGRWLISLAEK